MTHQRLKKLLKKSIKHSKFFQTERRDVSTDSDILLTEFVPNNQEQTPNDLHESSSFGSQNSSAGSFKHSNTFWNKTRNNSTDNTRTMLDTPRSRFHITIEPSLCLAFGGCESIAPRVFVVDKNKRINPKAKVESETGDNLERILLAASSLSDKSYQNNR